MTQPFRQRERIVLSDLNKEFPDPNIPGEFPDQEWVFWCSPTVEVWSGLALLSTTQAERDAMPQVERDESDDRLMWAISELVLDVGDAADTRGEPLDFSTPESTREVFLSPHVDRELLGGVIKTYLAHLMNRRLASKKKLEVSPEGSNTGATNGRRAALSQA